MYGFPQKLGDPSRGEQQYQDINRAVQNNSEVRSLIEQLETYYDRTLVNPDNNLENDDEFTNNTSLAPNIEDFLREVGGRLDTPTEDEED